MSKRKWFMHILTRSLTQRKGRVFVASASVMIAVGIMIGALSISMGIRAKLGGELKAYGANVIISSTSGYLSQREMNDVLFKTSGVEDFSFQLYHSAIVRDSAIEIIGMDISAAGNWKLTGAAPSSINEVLAGADVMKAYDLRIGDSLALVTGDRTNEVLIVGSVETGGAEDKSLLAPVAAVREFLNIDDSISAVMLRVDTGVLDSTLASLRTQLPSVEVKTLRQVAMAEENFLKKIELLMALVTIVVFITSAISVSSTMSATVLERLKEIGLMKAIGGTKRSIGIFYLTEAGIIGVTGGLMGFVLGIAAAQAVTRGAFGSYVSVPVSLVFLAVFVGIAVSVLASLMPLSGALLEKPSVILRGD